MKSIIRTLKSFAMRRLAKADAKRRRQASRRLVGMEAVEVREHFNAAITLTSHRPTFTDSSMIERAEIENTSETQIEISGKLAVRGTDGFGSSYLLGKKNIDLTLNPGDDSIVHFSIPREKLVQATDALYLTLDARPAILEVQHSSLIRTIARPDLSVSLVNISDNSGWNTEITNLGNAPAHNVDAQIYATPARVLDADAFLLGSQIVSEIAAHQTVDVTPATSNPPGIVPNTFYHVFDYVFSQRSDHEHNISNNAASLSTWGEEPSASEGRGVSLNEVRSKNWAAWIFYSGPAYAIEGDTDIVLVSSLPPGTYPVVTISPQDAYADAVADPSADATIAAQGEVLAADGVIDAAAADEALDGLLLLF